jgi:hypothetical protein
VTTVDQAPTVITNDSGAVEVQLSGVNTKSNINRDGNHGHRDKRG